MREKDYSVALLDASAVSKAKPLTLQESVYAFLDAKTPVGAKYEWFTIFLIILNVLAFIVGAELNPKYNKSAPPCDWCGVVFAGSSSIVGDSSILEIFTVGIFTIEYIIRFWAIGCVPEYQGTKGKMKFVLSFFSLIDLISIIPFYVDLCIAGDLPASQFLRMFRLFRMMRVEGRYIEAFTLFDDVIRDNSGILMTSGFCGAAIWVICASLYYYTEHENYRMVYCPKCPDLVPSNNTCVFDEWGKVDCAPACPSECWNLFESIPESLYFTLLNLFGEFPLLGRESTGGKVIATFTTIVAAAIFSIFASVMGNGFADILERRKNERDAREKKEKLEKAEKEEEARAVRLVVEGVSPREEITKEGDDLSTPADSLSKALFDVLNAKTPLGLRLEYFLFVLIFANVLMFMLQSMAVIQDIKSDALRLFFDYFELLSVMIFTIEYVVRFYATVTTQPQWAGWRGRLDYATTFYSIVDLVSIIPFYIDLGVEGFGHTGTATLFVRSLRSTFHNTSITILLVRVLKADQYVKAFTIMDDVFLQQSDLFVVTGFTALVLWLLFSAVLYYSERDNADVVMRGYYNTVSGSMWVTLLNLSGESPLAMYSPLGKFVTGICGIFAAGFFGIPVGILGAGFQQWIEPDNGDDDNEKEKVNEKENKSKNSVDARDDPTQASNESVGVEGTDPPAIQEISKKPVRIADTPANVSAMPLLASKVSLQGEYTPLVDAESPKNNTLRAQLFRFVEGKSTWGHYFEKSIFILIFASLLTTMIETVKATGCDTSRTDVAQSGCKALNDFEVFSVIVFTGEYLLRLYTAPEHPGFAPQGVDNWCRLRYLASFYSIIDLLAIVPFYIVVFTTNPWMDAHDGFFRMLRVLRLFKLDKYVPSISLIDDVFRAKQHALTVAGFVAGVLWVIFATLLYLAERNSHQEEGLMAERFANIPIALQVTMIHLTGDYPLIDYGFWGRFINFFMVIAAAGVVGVPSGLVADGFVSVVKDTQKANLFTLSHLSPRPPAPTPPAHDPSSAWDRAQLSVHEFLNPGPNGPASAAYFERGVFALILLNILAVFLESVPHIDRGVGNAPGNAFDVFEAISVVVFTFEFALRVFSVRYDSAHEFSRMFYLTTFFGVVDIFAILPWYIQLVLEAAGVRVNVFIFRIARVFRILQLEHFVEAFTLLDDVYRASKQVLQATGLLALVIWVGSATLFYLSEQGNSNFADIDAFQNVFDSLYFTAVFLGGEWGLVDFTLFGKILSIILCVLGLALFAIPIGTLFEAFEDIIGKAREERLASMTQASPQAAKDQVVDNESGSSPRGKEKLMNVVATVVSE